MPVSPEPSADAITIAEALDLLDGRFAALSAAVERRGFALWVGSGISLGRAPNVGQMLGRALEHLRQRANPADANCRFRRALVRALEMSGLDEERRAGVQFDVPFDDWPEKEYIIEGLWDRYAQVLDIRIAGEDDDYMLWEAVDVRDTYGMIDDPDCEHLCIAILVMEGAIADIASANWDGLIEAAIMRLGGGAALLQVVVDPAHLRDQPARSRLIKFHGCANHCVYDPDCYRHYLIATQPQITYWPHNPSLHALRHQLIGLATNSRTLMVGLSLQDTNLQDLFAAARAALPWSWPCSPDAQGHVFCEDVLGDDQVNMLRVVYGDAYGPHETDIKSSALLRAYAKQALLALVLHVLSAKLTSLATSTYDVASGELSAGIKHLRGRVAAVADGDPLVFVNGLVRFWSRGMALFRRGVPRPAGCEMYGAISPLPIHEMVADPNISTSGLPELAIGLALLGLGETGGKWTLSLPLAENITDGALQATGAWADAQPTQIYFVNGAATAVELMKRGAIATENVIVIHSDDAWSHMSDAGLPRHRSPTGAPGRTGQPPIRHVSIRQLLQSPSEFATLEQRFAEEISV